jgi:hypothetical protein
MNVPTICVSSHGNNQTYPFQDWICFLNTKNIPDRLQILICLDHNFLAQQCVNLARLESLLNRITYIQIPAFRKYWDISLGKVVLVQTTAKDNGTFVTV